MSVYIQESEIKYEEVRKKLSEEEEKTKEVNAVLVYGTQRSRQQAALMKEMHSVIQKQQRTLQVSGP